MDTVSKADFLTPPSPRRPGTPSFSHGMAVCLFKELWWVVFLLEQFIWWWNNNISNFLDKFQYSFWKKNKNKKKYPVELPEMMQLKSSISHMGKERSRELNNSAKVHLARWRRVWNEPTSCTHPARECSFCSPGLALRCPPPPAPIPHLPIAISAKAHGELSLKVRCVGVASNPLGVLKPTNRFPRLEMISLSGRVIFRLWHSVVILISGFHWSVGWIVPVFNSCLHECQAVSLILSRKLSLRFLQK